MPVKFRLLLPILILNLHFAVPTLAQNKKGQRMFYELKLYHFTTLAQETMLDNYLAKAYIPALHRAGISHIGAFKPISNDTAAGKRLYVLIPFTSLDQKLTVAGRLQKDMAYINEAKPYSDAPFDNPPYRRMESILLQAFRLAPVLTLPRLTGEKSQRVFELRSYESPTEKINLNKVQMFNEGGEIPLFQRLGFNAIFYGEVIAGSQMPNLMYMTSFENIADREAHWQTFRADAEWKALSGKTEYKNNVSKNEQILTHPTSYSDY